MLKRKLGLLVAAAVMVGMFTSCVNVIRGNDENKPENQGGNGGNTVVNDIDYTNYIGGNYSIKVRNDTSKNVVCFKSTPSAATLISGAKAGDTTGLKLNTDLFTTSSDFVLFVVTEEDYLANKNDLSVLANKPFVRLYAYYNESSDNNNNVYTISKSLGGLYKIYLNNMTKYNVELRKDGLYGDALAYSGKMTIKTAIGVEEGDYDLFPVFRKFDSKSGEILNCYPKTKKGNPQYFAFSLDNTTTEYEIDASNFIDTASFDIAPSEAQITINNQSKTGVSLFKGTGATAMLTSTGGKNVNPGKQLTYSIEMDKLGQGQYQTQRTISGWLVGTSAQKYEIPENVFEAGYRYTVIVKGESYDDLTVSFEKIVNTDEILRYKFDFDSEE